MLQYLEIYEKGKHVKHKRNSDDIYLQRFLMMMKLFKINAMLQKAKIVYPVLPFNTSPN